MPHVKLMPDASSTLLNHQFPDRRFFRQVLVNEFQTVVWKCAQLYTDLFYLVNSYILEARKQV
jgi:hypothetical protein